MEHIVHLLIAAMRGWTEAARMSYRVDPIIWLIIGTAASPVFYYSIYRVVRAVTKKSSQEIMLWSMIFGCAVLAPYLYVLLFGRNLPWWVYAAIVLLIGQGAYTLVRKVRGKKVVSAEGKPPEVPLDSGNSHDSPQATKGVRS